MADHKAKQRLCEFIIQWSEVKASLFHGEGWSCWLVEKKYEDFTRQNCINQFTESERENNGQEKINSPIINLTLQIET